MALAAALAAVLVLVYTSNRDFVPGHDATPNAYLAAQLLEGGGLAFTPSGAPHLFSWVLRTPSGEQEVTVSRLDEPFWRWSARELYGRGTLVPFPPYYLAPTLRRDATSGEQLHVGLYGLGAAFSALPVLAPVRWVTGDLRGSPASLWHGSKAAAAVLAAASAALLYVLARRFVNRWPAILLALAYGLGTPLWSMSSQALSQHAPNGFFIIAGALALSFAGRNLWPAAISGAAFSAAAACRPTSALFAVAAAAWLLARDRRSALAFVAGALPFASAMATYNAWYLGTPFSFGQGAAHGVALAKTGSPDLWRPHFASSIGGLFFSPGRGVFTFSPFLLFSVPGLLASFRDERFTSLRPFLLGGALVLAVDAAWFDWWGGWSYGWRRLVDLAPVLVIALAPVLPLLRRSRWARGAFALALAWAVSVQSAGAFAFDLYGWNARRAWQFVDASGHEQVTLDELEARAMAGGGARVEQVALDVDDPRHRHRLWSLSDNPMSYYLLHFREARKERRAAVEAWVEGWRPRGDGPGAR